MKELDDLAITPADIRDLAEHLAKTERGRSAMRHVLAWLNDDGLALDSDNQAAITLLLNAAWGRYAGTTRNEMQFALQGEETP